MLLAVDVGGTSTRGVLVSVSDARISARYTIETPTGDSGELLEGLRVLKHELESNAKATPIATGIALACPVDPKASAVPLGQKLGLKHSTDFLTLLRGVMSSRCFVHTELSMSALGEHSFGVGRGHSNIVVLTIGTGVGAGVIANDELVLGANGFAGEIGHIPVTLSSDARRCSCGRKGCLETYACGGAVTFATDGDSDCTPREVLEAAKHGEGDALKRVRAAGAYAGLAAAVCINAYNPELVVMRGGFIRALWPLARGDILAAVNEAALCPDTPIMLSPLRDDGVFFGLLAQWKRMSS